MSAILSMTLFTLLLWLLTECFGEVILKSSKVAGCVKICHAGCCYNVTTTCCNTTCGGGVGGGGVYCLTVGDDTSLLDILWRVVFIVPFVAVICGFKKIIRIFRDSCTTQTPERCRHHHINRDYTGDNSTTTSIQDSTERPLLIGRVINANNSEDTFIDTSATEEEMTITNNSRSSSALTITNNSLNSSALTITNNSRNLSAVYGVPWDTDSSNTQYNDYESYGRMQTSVNQNSRSTTDNLPPPSYEDATKNDPPRYHDVIHANETWLV